MRRVWSVASCTSHSVAPSAAIASSARTSATLPACGTTWNIDSNIQALPIPTARIPATQRSSSHSSIECAHPAVWSWR